MEYGEAFDQAVCAMYVWNWIAHRLHDERGHDEERRDYDNVENCNK